MAINTLVQGTAAEIMKLAMINLHKELKGLSGARMILTVHDEIIVETKTKDAIKVKELAKKTMETALKLCLPLEVEVNIADNWAEAK